MSGANEVGMECSLSNDHVFTGPDGKEYVWSVGNTTKVRGTLFNIDDIDDEAWISFSAKIRQERQSLDIILARLVS